MKSLILCCVLISYFVMGLCDARECFRQTFEKISCSQAVRANTVIETQSEQPECFSMEEGLDLVAKVDRLNGNGGKFRRMFYREKKRNFRLRKQLFHKSKQVKRCRAGMDDRTKKVVRTVYTKAKLQKCGVGMQDVNKIRDSQITGSSMWDANHRPQYGRLYETRGVRAWCVGRGKVNNHQWIRVDLKRNTKIIGVVTHGRPRHGRQWVEEFSMQYQKNAGKRTKIVDGLGNLQIFKGNVDYTNPVVNIFRAPITARWFTIRPIRYNNWMSMQFDLLTC